MGFLEELFAGKIANNLSVTVTKPSGAPVVGASVVIRDPNGNSLNASLFYKEEAITDQYGTVGQFRFLVFPQPYGVCTITATAPGYLPETIRTSADFDSTGLFSIVLTPGLVASEDYGILTPPEYVSALAPIVFSVTIPDGADIDRIITIVESSKGKISIVETDYYTDQTIEIDIRSAIHLSTLPVVVPVGAKYVDDVEFSETFFVSFAAEKGDTRTAIKFNSGGQVVSNFNLNVANFRPSDYVDSLVDYVGKPGKWISKRDAIPVGYYSDLMLWFPVTDPAGVICEFEQHTANGQLAEYDSFVLQPSYYVQRIKLPTEPVPGVVSLRISIRTRNGAYLFDILTIKYLYGY